METFQPFTALFQNERLVALSDSTLDLIFVVLLFHYSLFSRNLKFGFKVTILFNLIPNLAVYLHPLFCAHFFIISQCHLLTIDHRLWLSEPANQRSCRLLIVRNHVVPTNLGTVLHSFERIIGISRAVILEKLLDSGRLILAAHIFTREQTYCAKLVATDKGLAID